jgi:anti-anti-sigma factor
LSATPRVRGSDDPPETGIVRDLPPPFCVEVHPQREFVRVRPVGEIDVATVDRVRGQFEDLKAVGFTRIVLDMRDVTFVDSTGLRLMLEAQESSRADGWEFAVIDGSSSVQHLLQVTGMRHVLDFVDADQEVGNAPAR